MIRFTSSRLGCFSSNIHAGNVLDIYITTSSFAQPCLTHAVWQCIMARCYYYVPFALSPSLLCWLRSDGEGLQTHCFEFRSKCNVTCRVYRTHARVLRKELIQSLLLELETNPQIVARHLVCLTLHSLEACSELKGELMRVIRCVKRSG